MGRTRRAPSIFCRDRAPDFVRPRQKECTKSCELTLKITIFLRFWGVTPPQTTPVAPCAEVLQSLNLAPPILKNPGSAPDLVSDYHLSPWLN